MSSFFSKLLDEAVDRMRELSGDAWRLYCFLLRCRNRQSGQCNPSATTCAKAIGVSLNHIYKLRRELSKVGWVSFSYGAATFLIGDNPIHRDRVDDLAEEPNPIPTDRQPYPAG